MRISGEVEVEKAIKIILDAVTPLLCEEIELAEALDRILAEDIYADINIPSSDTSTTGGYAVRSIDTNGASFDNPEVFEIIGNLKAGDISSQNLGKNQAIKIMPEAAIPAGADCVVNMEDTEREGRDKIKIFKEVKEGENIRREGKDIKKGELVFSRGTFLTSSHIGILADLKKAKVKLRRKCKVAVLAAGNSNTYILKSQILKCGAIPRITGIARDKPEELEKKIKDSLDCDLILTSGEVAGGEYDLAMFVLLQMGTDIKVCKVAMEPEKFLYFGLIKKIPVLGLPGNTAANMVSFELFVRPAILKMLGQNSDIRKEADAVIEETIENKKGIKYFLMANTRWEKGVYLTRTIGDQGSETLQSLALANSLIILPEEKIIEKGRRVTVRFLD